MTYRLRLLLIGIAFVGVASFLVVSILYMGIFGKLFGKSADASVDASPSAVASSHQQDWAAYLTTIENVKVGSIMVDLGLKAVAPVTNKPNRLRVQIPMNTLDENGLPSPQEFEALNNVDESVSTALVEKTEAIYAGHLYHEGVMTLYYYAGEDSRFDSVLSEAMSAFPNYKHGSQIDRDENWEFYRDFLYPLPIQLQSIGNQKTINIFAERGDKLDKERQVDHWIYFSTDQDRQKFLATIEGKGFKVEKQDVIEATDGRPFLLQISRFDKLTSAAADQYMLELWQIAEDCNGNYDGWESYSVKE